MARVQKQFEQFHESVRADYGMNSVLCEKKDIIVNRIRKHLREKSRPGFTELLQGSYKMKTGVVPTSGLEYDIDAGLRFDFSEKDYEAKTVRKWVFEAVDGHTEKVDEKGPCIRVTYADGYHVDLVCYAVWQDTVGVEQYRLAHKTDGWVPADPPKLLEHVKKKRAPFKKPYCDTTDVATKTDQFRREVRYLKRWNDVAIPTDRHDKPTGLAFTLLCGERLSPRTFVDDGAPDDLTALYLLARPLGQLIGRIVANKPTPQYEDMFGRLSDEEMKKLKERFATLADTLDAAAREPDPVEACKKLQKVFGPDFPVPKTDDTAKKSSAPAIVTSSASA